MPSMCHARLRVLITDDNQPMRRMIRTVVDDLPVDLFEAADGEQSLQSYREHHPDLVLMDLAMPRMDGLQATREMVLAFPGARVIIVTQQDHAALREAARKAGALGYVLKENLNQVREFIIRINDSLRVATRDSSEAAGQLPA